MLVLKQRYLVPLVEGSLRMRTVQEIEPVLVVDLEVRGVNLVLDLFLPLSQALKEMREDSWYESSFLPRVSATHRVRLP